jgi:flagellar motility protein MotE (MotC chaperone)
MKAILPYIALFVGSLVIVGAVLGGIYAFQPDLLGFPGETPAQAPAAAPRADSTKAAPRAVALPFYGPPLAELRGKDPLNLARDSVAILRDSLRSMERLLAAERLRMDSLANARTAVNARMADAVKTDSATAPRSRDDKERKAMVKMLESMAADNVVKLLQGMSDEEVKELLLSLKTKQAAKILAALDPDRAAKLIR